MDHNQANHQSSNVNVLFTDNSFPVGGNGRPELYQKCNRRSHSSDTSSAYSGSDNMTPGHSSSLDIDEVDLSGLVESVVDSDEEDLAESIDSLSVRDTVRECLEKDPSDRTLDDIETLLEFTQKLKAFTKMTLAVRRALCSVMVFAVVERSGTIVMNDGEELDSWSVLINGHVEIEHSNNEFEHLHYGDSFGIRPTMDKLYHHGVMRTKCDDCQFVCITQTDYYRIQHQGEENIRKHEENGRVVIVTELRQGATEKITKKGYVVIRGTTDRLLHHLIEENTASDPTYVEDFLLTYRTFLNNPFHVARQLLDWFESDSIDLNENNESVQPVSDIRERVARVVLTWVNNHFSDFETDPQMMEFLEKFEGGLEQKNMLEPLRILHLYAKHKARERNVTLARSSRDENLNFQINGGTGGIFITCVEKKTKAEEVGLKRGDQILDVNGQNFEHVTYARAMELLMSTTHLSITVKSNLWAFKEIILNTEGNTSKRKVDNIKSRLTAVDLLQNQNIPLDFSNFMSPMKDAKHLKWKAASSSQNNNNKGGFMTLGGKRRIQKALIKMNLLPKNTISVDDNFNNNENYASVSRSSTNSSSSSLTTSGTITLTDIDESSDATDKGATLKTSELMDANLPVMYCENLCPAMLPSDYPEHILKVFKSDQTCKHLLVHKETTAHEVVMLALQEFGIHETSSNFSLCEVSVGEGGMIKHRRLPDQLQNLAERIGLSSRYYLKTNGITETLVSDDMAPELIRESIVHFLQLNANEIAIQLTLQDFSIFRQIESTEYIDDLFNLKSKYGVSMLNFFSELVNKEMFWVVTEVCGENSMIKRSKIVKQFIKIARYCKECKNFNSMFAIISGLGHAAVTRLRLTWEKLPSKYHKLFHDLQDLMDPSRNMSKYRQMVATELFNKNPIIPFYPVVKKDLTFIHLGNDTKVENLINFEKLRMISKEVRNLLLMCNSQLDMMTMLELKGQPPSSAMVALNQMSVHTSSSRTNTNYLQYNVGYQQTEKRRKKSTAAPNPQKMFDEAQMVRRVKAYLNNMKIITDEDLLHQMSLACEPQGGSAPNSVQIRKRNPSPTLSTTSSTSSTSDGKKGALEIGMSNLSIESAGSGKSGTPKFGAASPQAVKKILSLSEQTKTRPHQSRHSGIVFSPTLNISHQQNTISHHNNVLPHHHYPHLHNHNHNTGIVISPSLSPAIHRRSSNTTFTSYSTSHMNFVVSAGIISPIKIMPTSSNVSSASSTHNLVPRGMHGRFHPDSTLPVPSVDLSAESSSVASINSVALGKKITPEPPNSTDGRQNMTDNHFNCPEGFYHLASSIVHNTPSPPLQQRRRLSLAGPMATHYHEIPHYPYNLTEPSPPTLAPPHHSGMNMLIPPMHCPPRHPPVYKVAAQMARLQRFGRANSHEGVSNSNNNLAYFINQDVCGEDEDEAQVSAV